MNILIVGSGNVATILGRLIQNTKHRVVQVISREIAHARLLAEELGCDFTDYRGKPDPRAELYLFAISDTALYEMDKFFEPTDKLLLHTAGSAPKEVLKKLSGRYGVIYPLQSLQKNISEIPDIPLLVDGNNEETTQCIENFAREISSTVSRMNDEQRLKLHVAAVFVNNFTNHLYQQAFEFCEKEGLDFNLLKPLITETAHRVLTHSPKDVQTGPAIRNDVFTLEKHLRMLTGYPKQKYLYLKLTDSIINK